MLAGFWQRVAPCAVRWRNPGCARILTSLACSGNVLQSVADQGALNMFRLSVLRLGAYVAVCMSAGSASANDFNVRCSTTEGLQVCVSAEIGRLGIDNLTALELDDILPGWNKLPGKSSRAVFK